MMPSHVYHPRPERWTQVSLRGFFLLVTMLCVFFGWLGVQLRWIHERDIAISAQAQHGQFLVVGIEPPLSLRPFGVRGVCWIDIPATDDREADEELRNQMWQLFPEARGTRRFDPITFHDLPQ